MTTCGWCATEAEGKTCPGCGHRADLPRAECDCPRCEQRRAAEDAEELKNLPPTDVEPEDIPF